MRGSGKAVRGVSWHSKGKAKQSTSKRSSGNAQQIMARLSNGYVKHGGAAHPEGEAPPSVERLAGACVVSEPLTSERQM